MRYRLSGVAVAYDDVVDVNLQVWGDEWQTGLDRLTAALALPAAASGPAYRVYGAPAYVRGVVGREPTRATLEAVFDPVAPVRRAAGAVPSLAAHLDRPRDASSDGVALPRIVAEQQARGRPSSSTGARRSTTRSRI